MLKLLAVMFLAAGLISCRKGKGGAAEHCSPRSATIRQISNRPATVKVTGTINYVYLVEDGSIDTKLIPCSLSKQFITNDLPVVLSADVQAGTPAQNEPCCTEDIVITKITLR